MKPLNDHIRVQELFSAYLDHQTTADEKKFIERHLTVCDQDCRAVLAATRSMIQSTRSLPRVKAPRSFVLPRSLARQPSRSIFEWYPALRLATSIAVIALMLVFAGDVFSPHNLALNANVPSGASAPQLSIVAAPTASAGYASPAPAPLAAQAPAPQSAAGVLPTATSTASVAADAAALARSGLTSTNETITATTVQTQAVAFASPPTVQPTPEAAPESVASAVPALDQVGALEQQPQPAAPASNPLRLIEIALAALVIGLAAATLIVRQRTRSR